MTITPAMQQFYDMKQNYSDSLLFFRMWDFYELFDDDALIAHKILWIALTTRNKNAEKPTPLAGIPYHAKEKYLPLLVEAGYKVAIAEQVSDPKLKWIVKREVVRVVTPATLELEGENYDTSAQANIILSLSYSEKWYGCSSLDITSNKWEASEYNSLQWLCEYIYKMAPKEVIGPKELLESNQEDTLSDILSQKYNLNIYYCDTIKNAYWVLIDHFWTQNLISFWIENHTHAIIAAAQLLNYISWNQKENLDFLTNLSYIENHHFMGLDESTIQSLDLVYNYTTKSASVGTLYGVLNKTKTPMGWKYLKQQILQPLQDIDIIKKRLSYIDELIKNKALLDNIQKKLWSVANIDAILNRLALNRATPRDLIQLKNSLIAIQSVQELIAKKWSNTLKQIFLS